MTAAPELLDDEPTSYEKLIDDFHDKIAARVGAAIEKLEALQRELEEIQLDLETGP